jgi:DNA-binding Lrp family transcriptional regulator
MPATVFVFSPDASYGFITTGRFGGNVSYVAAVSGPWKIFAVIDFDDVGDVPGVVDEVFKQEDASGDPETALTLAPSSVRKTHYYDHTALVRIDTDVVDPGELIDRIKKVTGSDEVDSVMGDFDILACIGDDDGEELAKKVMAIRELKGITRTVSLHVLDYRSRSEHAPEGKRVQDNSA